MSAEQLIILILAILALVLAGLDVYRSRGQALTSWAAGILAVCFIIEKAT